MATIIERKTKKGVSYKIQVRVKNKGTGEYETKAVTWTGGAGLSPRETKKQLQDYANEFERTVRNEYELGLPSKRDLTVADYSVIWLDFIKANRSLSYHASVKHIIKELNSKLGSYKLKELSPVIIQKYIDNLKKDSYSDVEMVDNGFTKTRKELGLSKEKLSKMSGVSTTTILKVERGGVIEYTIAEKIANALNKELDTLFKATKKIKTFENATLAKRCRVLRAMLGMAKKQQYIEHNYATNDYVDNIKEKPKEKIFLDDIEIKELVYKIKDYPNIRAKTAILVLIFTGLRRGELCGLEWQDIDLVARTMSIRRACLSVSGVGVVIGETKTANSKRTITMPQILVDTLTEYKKWWDKFTFLLGDRYGGCQSLFLQEDGTMLYPSTIRYWLKRVLDEFGMKNVTVHSLRHSNITIQLAAGVPLKTVSARAGHSSTKVTSEVYAHMIDSSDRAAANRLDELLG